MNCSSGSNRKEDYSLDMADWYNLDIGLRCLVVVYLYLQISHKKQLLEKIIKKKKTWQENCYDTSRKICLFETTNVPSIRHQWCSGESLVNRLATKISKNS